MDSFVKVACKHCPFRNDVKPFLHPDRASDLAHATENRYGDFPCHKTTEYDEESEDGNMLVTNESLTCAGFLTLRAQSGEDIPEGFNPSWDICYADPYDMIQAYEEEWNKKHK